MDFKNAMDLMGKDSHLGNHFCSGMCNAALKSTSTVCANNALETHVKTIADDDLLYCSSCEHLYNHFGDVCPDSDDERGRGMTRQLDHGGGKGGGGPCEECNAAIKAVQTGCDAAKLDAYKLSLSGKPGFPALLTDELGAYYFSCDLGEGDGPQGGGPIEQ